MTLPDRSRGALRSILRLLLLALGLALAGWVLRELGEDHGIAFMSAQMRGGGLWAEALFVLVGAAATAVVRRARRWPSLAAAPSAPWPAAAFPCWPRCWAAPWAMAGPG